MFTVQHKKTSAGIEPTTLLKLIVHVCYDVTGPHTGVTPQAAALCFFHSQMVVVDEDKHRHRAGTADLCDMCEALARLAEWVSSELG